MTRRLIARTGPGGPLPPRQPLRCAWRRAGPSGWVPPGARRPARPAAPLLLLGTVSLLAVLGTAAFSAGGGGQAPPGRGSPRRCRCTASQHAIITGEVPISEPVQAGVAHVRAGLRRDGCREARVFTS